jgi:hypothetical protein
MKLVRGQKVQMEVFACAIYFVLLAADIHPSSLSSSLIWATTVNEFPTPGKNRSLICHTLVRTTFHFFLGTRASLVFFLRSQMPSILALSRCVCMFISGLGDIMLLLPSLFATHAASRTPQGKQRFDSATLFCKIDGDFLCAPSKKLCDS